MAPHERLQQGSLKSTLIGLLAICLGVVFCSTITVWGIDALCASDIDRWQPIYPNSELVQIQQSGFFRARGSGITEATYFTTDSQVEVGRWYLAYRRELTRGSSSGDSETAARGVSSVHQNLEEAADGSGTFIHQYSECAYN